MEKEKKILFLEYLEYLEYTSEFIDNLEGGESYFKYKGETYKCERCGCSFLVTKPLISELEAKEAWNKRDAEEYTSIFR